MTPDLAKLKAAAEREAMRLEKTTDGRCAAFVWMIPHITSIDGRIVALPHGGTWEGEKFVTTNPRKHPHGRLSWSIYFSGHRFYIDLSVMPATATPPVQGSEKP